MSDLEAATPEEEIEKKPWNVNGSMASDEPRRMEIDVAVMYKQTTDVTPNMTLVQSQSQPQMAVTSNQHADSSRRTSLKYSQLDMANF